MYIMKKFAVLLSIAVGVGLCLPSLAVEITQLKAVSLAPGSNPPFRAEVTALNASVVDTRSGVNTLGTYQADLIVSGGGGTSVRSIPFSQRPSGSTFSLEGREVASSNGQVGYKASCTYSMSPASASVSADGGTFTIKVTANKTLASPAVVCAWTSAENEDWISISSGTTDRGNGEVEYVVQPNDCGGVRQGFVVVAGMLFAVTQQADIPTVTIAPTLRVHDDKAGSGFQIAVSDPCGIGWTASAPAAWIHITSATAGVGNGAVVYRIDANDRVQSRTGTVSVGPRSFVVQQEGIDCTYSVSRGTTPVVYPYEGGDGCLTLTAPGGCPWSAVPNCGWVSVTSGASGSGSGSICIEVAENLTTNNRFCAISVAGGQATYTVIQAAGPCQWSLAPSPAVFEFPREGGADCFDVLSPSGCEWTAENQSATWVEILSGGVGVGDGSVCYRIAPNPDDEVRTGSIRVRDQVATFRQASACTSPCGAEEVTERRPTFEWCPVQGATWYKVSIHRNGKSHFEQWLEQSASTWTPDFDLPCGAYQWWVRAWVPGVGMSDWTSACTFNIEDCCIPDAVTGPSPDGVCMQPGRIDYLWDVDPCASHYQLWIGLDGKKFHAAWHETGLLPPGTVSETISGHVFGEYTWWIRGWGPDGMGTWTGPVDFSVGKPQPLGPSGAVASPVYFAWDDDCTAQASWYHFWVTRNGKKYWVQWVPAGDTGQCAPGVRCLDGMTVEPGNYTWWMRSYIAGGMGPWSKGTEFLVQ